VLAHYQARQRIKNKRMQATTPTRLIAPTSLDMSCKRRFISITFLRMPSKTCFSSSGIIVIPHLLRSTHFDLASFSLRNERVEEFHTEFAGAQMRASER
jgi:hypothetical protein